MSNVFKATANFRPNEENQEENKNVFKATKNFIPSKESLLPTNPLTTYQPMQYGTGGKIIDKNLDTKLIKYAAEKSVYENMSEGQKKSIKYKDYSYEDILKEIDNLKLEYDSSLKNGYQEGDVQKRKQIQSDIDWFENFITTRDYGTVKEYDNVINKLQAQLDEYSKRKSLTKADTDNVLKISKSLKVLKTNRNKREQQDQINEKYYSLLDSEDFEKTLSNAENFAKAKLNDINNPNYAKAKQYAEKQSLKSVGTAKYGVEAAIPEDMKDLWNQTTEDEKKIYSYLALGKGGKMTALQFLKDISPELKARATAEAEELQKYDYENSGFWGKVGMNVLSVPANVFGNIAAGAGTALELIGSDRINPYSSSESNALQKWGNYTRELTANEIDEAIDSNFLSKIAVNTYQGIMSNADMMLGAATLGGTNYTSSMAMGSFASTARQMYERGESKAAIALGASLSALLEFATEKIGMDRFLETFGSQTAKSFIKNLGLQIAAEPLEELVSAVGNRVIDNAVSGGTSEYRQSIQNYISMGLSRDEAVKKADADFAVDTFWQMYSATVSVLSSVGASGGNYLIATASRNKALTNIANTIISENKTAVLFDIAKTLNVDQKFTNISNTDVKAVAKLYGKVIESVNSQIDQKSKDAIISRLQELGNIGDSQRIADTILQMAKMDELDESDIKILKKNKAAYQVYLEFLGDEQADWVEQLYSDTAGLRVLRNVAALSGDSNIDTSEIDSAWQKLKEVYNFNSSDVDNATLNDYNNNRGEANNESIVQGISGSNKERSENRNYPRTESENARTWKETEKSFTRRAQEDVLGVGKGKRRILKQGNSQISYVEKETDNSNAGNAVKRFEGLGVKAVLCDGDIETNQNGITTSHSNAVTAPDGTVYVSSNSTLSDIEIVSHEIVHIHNKNNTQAYIDFEDVICENILFDSESCKEVFLKINNLNFDGRYDVNDPFTATKLLNELVAYINQGIVTNSQLAEETFSGMFADWNDVVAATEKFNNDIGADFSESVFSLSEGDGNESDVIDVPEEIKGIAISNENKKRHHTTQAEQQYLREVANAIGVKLDFAHIADFLKQRNVVVKGITPDAVVTGDGHIVIGFNVTKPTEALLKHELSDYLFMNLSEADAQELMNTAMDTQLFENWLKSKGYSNATEYSADIIAIRQAVNDPNFVGKSDNDLEYQSYIEMTSDFIAEQCFDGEKSINGLVEVINKKQGILDRISQRLKNLIAKIKYHGIPSLEMELGQVERQFAKAFNSVNGQNKNTADSGVRFSIAESFQKTLSNWDKKTVGFSFIVGNTSKVLKEAGIPDKQIRLDATKVKALLEKHSGMTVETISQIPELLEKPIFVIDSKSNENAKIVMGDLYDENGKIVTVVLLLTPTSKKGNQLDIIKISSAEGRSHIESLFKNTDGSNVSVRYMDKKRVQDWLNVNRLQLPLHSFNLNSNNNITENNKNVKQMQFEIISKSNPANDSYHTWIRSAEDIKTFEETLQNSDWKEYSDFDPDYTRDMAQEAIKSGEIKVYSSYPIKQGVFVTPSKIEAESYSGSGKVYEKTVKLTNVAWIDPTQGMYADITKIERTTRNGGQTEFDNSVAASGSPSIDSIHENNDTVNSNDMQENKNNSDIRMSVPVDNAEDLIARYDNGEITKEQLAEIIGKKKKENPATIANLTPEDASTTPKLNRKKGEAKGNKESKTYGSLLESSIFDDTFKSEVETDDFIRKYQSISNAETLRAAARELDEGGMAYVNKWWAKDSQHASLIDTAVGFILMDRYQRTGDYESAIAVTEKIREIGTASGQQVQIFSILGRFDPNTMAIYSQKELSQAFEIMCRSRTQKWIDKYAEQIMLTDSEIDFIRRLTLQASRLPNGSRAQNIKLAEIATMIQNKMPPQKGQAIKAYQRICMLLNPKTQLRNVMGNAGMVGVFKASDIFGVNIDRILYNKAQKKGFEAQRTVGAIRKGETKENLAAFKDGVCEAYDDFRRKINTREVDGNRFEIQAGKAFNENQKGILSQQRNDVARVFNSLDRLTTGLLDAGDRGFYQMWFVNSLNNQMKLNKVSEPTRVMIEIAAQEALERTWQDNNRFTRSVQALKNIMNLKFGNAAADKTKLNVLADGLPYGLGDMVIKYTKTPANLAKAIFEYSPAGLVKAISLDSMAYHREISKGNYSPQLQHQYAQSLGKGIAGTLTQALVFTAMAFGWITLTGKNDDDKDVRDFENYILGMPEYSIKIFGKYFTYEWAQPFGAFFAVGADTMKSIKENPDGEWYEHILAGIEAGGDILLRQSFMSSVQTFFEYLSDGVVEAALETVFGDTSVYVPQILSQFAELTDDYRRVTYDNNMFKSAFNKIINKVPIARKSLEKQVDVLGRDVENPRKDVFNAFFNPGNTYTNTSNKVTDTVYELYKNTGEAKVIPRKAQYDVTVKKIKRQLSGEERADFQRISGSVSAELLGEAFETSQYQTMSDSEKVAFVEKIYNYAVAYAKSQIEWDYEILSAMQGNKSNGDPILTKEMYDKLSDKGIEELAMQYFLSKKEYQLEGNNTALIRYYLNQAKN